MPTDDITSIFQRAFDAVLPDRPFLAARLDAQLPTLSAMLGALYGAQPEAEAAFAVLAERMAEACATRPKVLIDIDAAREADPGWFLHPAMIGYSAYVDRFGGTLRGVADRVPYLESLGIRYLHLLPFWRARAGDNDGGFAVSDYAQVEPRLGHIDDIDLLAGRLRAAGISLCADLVLNHTADDHPWARAARAGDPACRAMYHVLPDEAAVAMWEASLMQVFPQTAPGNFTHVPEMGGWVWTTFYPYQWDLNYANPAVFAAMAGIVLSLANRGVEAFRLDSAAFLWKHLGTTSRSQPETHMIMRALRAVTAIVAPGVLLKSEVIAPVADAAAYLGRDGAPECHLAYHAGLMTAGWAALAEQDASTPRAVLDAVPDLPPSAGWVTYVRCHDDIGWQPLAPQAHALADGGALDEPGVQRRLRRISDVFTNGQGFAAGEAFQSGSGEQAHGINGTAASLAGLQRARTAAETEAALARLRLLYGVAFASGGLPLIYMGDEIGQLNDDTYRDDPARRHEGRWLHRPVFDAAGALAPGELARRLRASFDELRLARLALPALAPGNAPAAWPVDLPGVLAFTRGPSVLILCNFASEPVSVPVNDGWRAVLGEPPCLGCAPLQGFGLAWLKKAVHF